MERVNPKAGVFKYIVLHVRVCGIFYPMLHLSALHNLMNRHDSFPAESLISLDSTSEIIHRERSYCIQCTVLSVRWLVVVVVVGWPLDW